MNELIAMIAQKAGVSPEQAKTAAETVVGFLKTRLPAPIAGQIEGLLSESGSGAGGIGDVAKGLGSLFGKK